MRMRGGGVGVDLLTAPFHCVTDHTSARCDGREKGRKEGTV